MNLLHLAFGVCFVLVSLLYLSRNPQLQARILGRISTSHSKAKTSLTPPTSVSRDDKRLASSNTAQSQYGDVFPPHRRSALAELKPNALKGPGPTVQELSERPPNYTPLVPDKAVCNTDAMLHHTTPTGFTIEEIRRLGDFPDYATLSGMPLPNPYREFDIKAALPRPYRPYRWPYHQTMCKKPTLTSQLALTNLSTIQTRHRFLARGRQGLRINDQVPREALQRTWLWDPPSLTRIRASLQRTRGDCFAIPMRTISATLHSRHREHDLPQRHLRNTNSSQNDIATPCTVAQRTGRLRNHDP